MCERKCLWKKQHYKACWFAVCLMLTLHNWPVWVEVCIKWHSAIFFFKSFFVKFIFIHVLQKCVILCTKLRIAHLHLCHVVWIMSHFSLSLTFWTSTCWGNGNFAGVHQDVYLLMTVNSSFVDWRIVSDSDISPMSFTFCSHQAVLLEPSMDGLVTVILKLYHFLFVTIRVLVEPNIGRCWMENKSIIPT